MGLFSSKKKQIHNPFKVDMHSHLIYGVDDGASSLDESMNLIKSLIDLGYEKVITTPHIMTDFYKNSKDNLLPIRDTLLKEIEKTGLNFSFDVAAEYYLDDGFYEKLKDKDNLLLINNKYILVETSYMNEPNNLNSLIFEIQASGLTPILAHPERYIYMYDKFEKYEEIYEKGILFQLNINSLSGYYSKGAKKIAKKLIDQKMVHFAGTDCHGEKHIAALKRSFATKEFQNLCQLDIQNNTLL